MQILLVEDQAHSAAAIHSGLQQSAIAYDVHHCATLASALEALETRSFDAALIDLGLPHASGTDVVVAIKAVSPSMPLVILTDEDFDSLGEALLLSGIQDFLLKSEAHSLQSWLLVCTTPGGSITGTDTRRGTLY